MTATNLTDPERDLMRRAINVHDRGLLLAFAKAGLGVTDECLVYLYETRILGQRKINETYEKVAVSFETQRRLAEEEKRWTTRVASYAKIDRKLSTQRPLCPLCHSPLLTENIDITNYECDLDYNVQLDCPQAGCGYTVVLAHSYEVVKLDTIQLEH